MDKLIDKFENRLYNKSKSASKAHAVMAGTYASYLANLLKCETIEQFEREKQFIIKQLNND